MLNEPNIHTDIHNCSIYKRICWSAIFIGALVAVGLIFLLNLFGMAIGLSAFTLTSTGQTVVAIGGLLGLLIGAIASMLAAGYAAGYLGRFYCPRRNLGFVYGFSTWSLSLILSALIALPLSNFVFSSTYGAPPSVSLGSNNLAATATSNPVSVQTTSTPTQQNPNQKTLNVNASQGTLAWGGIGIFLLFFIGAISSCIGAHWGMSCKRDD